MLFVCCIFREYFNWLLYFGCCCGIMHFRRPFWLCQFGRAQKTAADVKSSQPAERIEQQLSAFHRADDGSDDVTSNLRREWPGQNGMAVSWCACCVESRTRTYEQERLCLTTTKADAVIKASGNGALNLLFFYLSCFHINNQTIRDYLARAWSDHSWNETQNHTQTFISLIFMMYINGSGWREIRTKIQRQYKCTILHTSYVCISSEFQFSQKLVVRYMVKIRLYIPTDWNVAVSTAKHSSWL